MRAHVVVHAGERGGVGVDDEVDPVVEGVERGVGHDAGDLDDDVLFDLETGHLEIDPHELVVGAVVAVRLFPSHRGHAIGRARHG